MNKFKYEIGEQGVLLTAYLGEEETILHIPERLEGYPVTAIAEGTFAENGLLLEEIVLPDTVAYIAPRAFGGCMSLTKLVLGEGVRELGEDFLMITAVEELYLPKTVERIEEPSMLSGLRLTVDEKNPWYHCDGYALYECRGGKKTLVGVRTFDQRTSYTVEDGTTDIGDNAFSGQEHLEEVILPHSVGSIGEAAFLLCDRLRSIYLPEGLTEIRKDAFAKCPALKHLHLPASLKVLAKGAVTGTFDWDYKKKGLYDITVEPGNPCFFVDESGLYERLQGGGLRLIKYLGQDRHVALKKEVRVIGTGAFRRSGVLKLELHRDIESIQKEAFFECRFRQIWMEADEVLLHIPGEPYALADEVISYFDSPLRGHLYGYDKYDAQIDFLKLCAEKVKMICCRLTYPVEVSPGRAAAWKEYLTEHMDQVMELIAQTEDMISLKALLQLEVFTADSVEQAIEICNSRGKSTLTGELMDYKNRIFGNTEFDFSL